MGRRGDLFDQDADAGDPGDPRRKTGGRRAHSGRGVLYDQDASMDLPRIDPIEAARYQRERDRLRDREIELRRDRERARRRANDGSARRASPPAQECQEPQEPQEPLGQKRQQAAPEQPGTPTSTPVGAAGAAGAARAAGATTRPPLRITSRAAPLHPPPPAPPAPPAAPAAPGPAPPSEPPSTGRATTILAAGTFASRLTGFIRVLVIGYVLGVSVLSDAFNYANGIPNIIYDLLIGGILSATLIPVFVEHLSDDDPAEASHSISAVMTAICAGLVVVSAVLWLAAPLVIHFYLLLSPKSAVGPERELATRLLRWFSPQVFFLGAIVATTALLNARRRFTAAAFSPVLNNVVAIAALLATKVVADHVLNQQGLSPSATLDRFGRDEKAVIVLGLGTTLGYAAQLVAQVPATHRLGLRLRPVWNLRHPAVRRVAGLSSWLVGVVVANQISLALVMVLAGRTEGGVTAYQFAYQFFQLPYALIAVSIASAIMPNLAEHYTARRRTAFERQFVTGLRLTLAVLIPVSLVYMAVALPFIELAIHHGAVGQSGAHLVTRTLIAFAVGLPGFSAFFLLMRAFQAMQDTRTMFSIYLIENAVTVVAALILSPLVGVPGLALAWVGPYTLASVYAVVRLRRRIGTLGGWFTIRALIRVLVASAVTVGVVVAVGLPFGTGESDAVLLARLVVQVGVGIGVYVALARMLDIRELRPLIAAASRILARHPARPG